MKCLVLYLQEFGDNSTGTCAEKSKRDGGGSGAEV